MIKNAARAERFALQLDVRYRRARETDWSAGRTENISRSGALFRAAGLLPVGAPVELSFVLPVGRTPLGVLCRGRIVRALSRCGPEGHPSLAVAITGYRFVPAKDAAA